MQVSENFPGIQLNKENRKIRLDTASFYQQLPDYAERSEDENTYKLSEHYAAALRPNLM